MTVTYRNPPLVEMIAELRWGPAAQDADGPAGRLRMPRPKDEEVFMHFAAQAAASGYARLERLLPSGLPLPPNQPVCRFRPTDPGKPSPLFQIGSGVFTANAVPPYRSWDEFLPVLRLGVDILFESYARASLPAPVLNLALVRYIDAFRPDLTGGMPPEEFVSRVLGLNVEVPRPIFELAVRRPQVKTELTVPIQIGMLTVAIGEGMRDTESAVMMDTTVLVHREIGANPRAAIGALSDARGVIHDLFEALTGSIRSAMQPES